MDLYFIFLHTLSQISRRWLSPRHIASSLSESLSKLLHEDLTSMSWTEEQWIAFAKSERSRWQDILKMASPKPIVIESILLEKCAKYCHNHITMSADSKAKIIPWGSDFYPDLLRHIPDPPLCLTVLGHLSALAQEPVTVVGSRRASFHSLQQATTVGHSLAEIGRAVVSGGAYGCDIACHRGALNSKQKMVFPITVFAGGLGQLYPKGNLDVFRQTVQRGGILISERLWNTPALPMDFPVRNRIVSGLSPETLVIEANRRSGALITARLALDQGRDVGVLNLPQNYQGGAGNHWLVDQGAMKFSDAQHWFHSRCMKERQMD